ncbi:hypothetical protein NONO_c43000 [Nocardia nova SH22a]|uniref:Uncharacterized protein n=1 Tax=Nocardia nova SH22a TaxID=1415166 RepID=W5TIU2_9NOCA|nr:hypothetical protein NONO_c43000 [Nocardia nova SH22a]
MLVVVPRVGGVAMAVVDVVDVVSVGYGDVPAALTVHMVVGSGVLGVAGRFAFVDMVAVNAVQVTVVHVVGVISVRHRDMSATFTVDMVVTGVAGVNGVRHVFRVLSSDCFIR